MKADAFSLPAESGCSAAPEREVLDWSDAVVSNLTAFAQAVTGRHDYPWSDAELIGNIAVYEAIVQSSDSGETVRLG